MKCRWGLRCIGLLLLALPLWAMAATRVALVVGNNAYQYGGVLANAIGDADKIGNALEQLGFQVIRKQNLTYAGLLSALDELGKAAMGADWVVVYYAGHAVQIAGKNHLVPVDVGLHREGDLRRTAKLDDLLTEVNQARELGLVILDACRDNPFAARLNQGRSVAGRGLAPVGDTGGSNTLVAFATAEDTIATDSGVYASVLAEYLKETAGASGVMPSTFASCAPDSDFQFLFPAVLRGAIIWGVLCQLMSSAPPCTMCRMSSISKTSGRGPDGSAPMASF